MPPDNGSGDPDRTAVTLAMGANVLSVAGDVSYTAGILTTTSDHNAERDRKLP
jgi:hypothetical protein